MVTKLSSLLLITFLFLAPHSASYAETAAPPLQITDENLHTQNSYFFNFGYWPVGSTAYRDFYFRTYQRNLRIYNIYTLGVAFRAYHNCPSRLYARRSCRIRVYFTPNHRGTHNGQTVISTSGGSTRIYLSGYGT